MGLESSKLLILNKQLIDATKIKNSRENPQIASNLLNAGADVNAKDKGGRTVLMLASKKGNAKIAKLLLDNGADINAIENGPLSFTALMYASDNGHAKIVELILDNPKHKNAWKLLTERELGHAATRGYTEIVKLFLDHSACEFTYDNTTVL